MCDEVLESFRDLESHMKEERHSLSLGQFKKTLPKPEEKKSSNRMEEDSDGY